MREYLEMCKNNIIISDAFTKANSVVNNDKYKNVMCSISGGADSDIMLDIISKIDYDKKVTYVFFDTGLEYKATKEHLKYLENRYDIKIVRERAVKPIPRAVFEYGQPFLSKFISEMLERLQAIDFDFTDNLSYEELLEKYPNKKEIINWWCNKSVMSNGELGRFNVSYRKYLKEFLIYNPPKFRISNKCCYYSKKLPSKHYVKNNDIDLTILGLRKSEGGIRASAYQNCYDNNVKDGADNYRPLFWFTQEDKEEYEKIFKIVHSDCYKEWGFYRTGCVGCPYARSLQSDLRSAKIYEPNMYKACCNIFKDSYEYTRQYKKFVYEMKLKEQGRRLLF